MGRLSEWLQANERASGSWRSAIANPAKRASTHDARTDLEQWACRVCCQRATPAPDADRKIWQPGGNAVGGNARKPQLFTAQPTSRIYAITGISSAGYASFISGVAIMMKDPIRRRPGCSARDACSDNLVQVLRSNESLSNLNHCVQ